MESKLATLCLDALGQVPDRVEVFRRGPTGAVRGTQRLHVGSRVVYATSRRDPAVTARETRVLAALGEQHAPVPRILGSSEGWLLVESVGPERLAQTLARQFPGEGKALLQRAIDSLARIHAAGRDAGLADVVPSYAHGEAIAKHLLQTLEAIGTLQGVRLPEFDGPAVSELLARPGKDFIKWDARPANAAVGPDGIVRWYDWQHANRRHRADDLIWLLCDEFVPDALEPATLLVETTRAWREDLPRTCALGCAHVGVRIHGILTGAAGLDISFEACLANDWLGSRRSARRLCRRGAAVAREAEVTRPLVDWYRRLADTFAPLES